MPRKTEEYLALMMKPGWRCSSTLPLLSILAQKITVFLPLIRTSVRSMLSTILGMMSFRHFNKFALL